MRCFCQISLFCTFTENLVSYPDNSNLCDIFIKTSLPFPVSTASLSHSDSWYLNCDQKLLLPFNDTKNWINLGYKVICHLLLTFHTFCSFNSIMTFLSIRNVFIYKMVILRWLKASWYSLISPCLLCYISVKLSWN